MKGRKGDVTFSLLSAVSLGQFHPRSFQPWTAGGLCSQNYKEEMCEGESGDLKAGLTLLE